MPDPPKRAQTVEVMIHMPKAILSASRRTDIPAFYMPWFMGGIERGAFEAVNPYNRQRRRVPAGPHAVHSIVFWSKNFGPFLAGNYDRRLRERGYRLFFNFTLNAPSPFLEPHIPPLKARLDQMGHLCRRHDPRLITWRFDPVCFFQARGEEILHDNLGGLEAIAAALAAMGIRRCVTSFVDLYPKVAKRLPGAGLHLVDPPPARKRRTLTHMAATLRPHGITLGVCCERTVLSGLPAHTGIQAGDCIPGPLLAGLHGEDMVLKKDPGQRRNKGCTCNVAVDVGSYHDHPCYHNCLFCYANPRPPHQAAAGRGREA